MSKNTVAHTRQGRRPVRIHTAIVGQMFGRIGIVTDADTRERLYETDVVPNDNADAARERAEEYCATQRQWEVVAS